MTLQFPEAYTQSEARLYVSEIHPRLPDVGTSLTQNSPLRRGGFGTLYPHLIFKWLYRADRSYNDIPISYNRLHQGL